MPLRILIVDDNPATRFILRDSLESSGHQVVGETETLAATVKAYSDFKPDVVTLDLSLADCDGLTIFDEIRRLDAAAKVIVISGNSQKKVLDKIRESGVSFLAKPFQIPDLLAAVSQAGAP